MKMEQTECSETSAYKIQTPGNYPEKNIKHVWTLLLHPPYSPDVAPSDFHQTGALTNSIHSIEFDNDVILAGRT
jgi:hypothetical protein